MGPRGGCREQRSRLCSTSWPASRWDGQDSIPRPHRQQLDKGRGWGASPWIRAQEPLSHLPPSPEVVMNCRETLLRDVRTISIKHNFLMKRLRGSLVELIRIECSLQLTLREGVGGQVPGSTWSGLEGPYPGPGKALNSFSAPLPRSCMCPLSGARRCQALCCFSTYHILTTSLQN